MRKKIISKYRVPKKYAKQFFVVFNQYGSKSKILVLFWKNVLRILSSGQILSIDHVKWKQVSNFSYRLVCVRVCGLLHSFSVLL